jgi:hypothetical protein
MPKRKLDPLPSAGPGTLYSSIQALLEEKFIEEVVQAGEAVVP